MIKKSLLAVLVLGMISIFAFAREYSRIRCKAEGCDYEGLVGEGPTRMREWITGYCSGCNKYVWRNWERPGGEPMKPEIVKVWDHETGKTRELFKCPDCERMVIAIHAMNEIKYCPKCNSDQIEIDKTHIIRD
jgi:hypothetical protein